MPKEAVSVTFDTASYFFSLRNYTKIKHLINNAPLASARYSPIKQVCWPLSPTCTNVCRRPMHCVDNCKALREHLQSFALAVAKLCVGGCKALREQ